MYIDTPPVQILKPSFRTLTFPLHLPNQAIFSKILWFCVSESKAMSFRTPVFTLANIRIGDSYPPPRCHRRHCLPAPLLIPLLRRRHGTPPNPNQRSGVAPANEVLPDFLQLAGQLDHCPLRLATGLEVYWLASRNDLTGKNQII